MSNPCLCRMTGPLAPFAGGLWESVIGRGYTRLQAEAHTPADGAPQSMDVENRAMSLAGLVQEQIRRSVEARRAEGYRTMVSVRQAGCSARPSASTGVLAAELHDLAGTDLDVLLGEYRRYWTMIAAWPGAVRYRVGVTEYWQGWVSRWRRRLKGWEAGK